MRIFKLFFPIFYPMIFWGFIELSNAGEIKGVVHFPALPKENFRTLSRYQRTAPFEMPAMQHMQDVKAVVYIAGSFPDTTFTPPKEHPIMDQRNEQFIPYILPILVGTTVDFPNNDRIYHNVFSFSKAKTFDLGKYPTKTKKSVKFDQVGIVSLYCEIHSHMNAFILVLPNPYFASLKQDGNFIIRDVLPGEYKLKIFLGRGEELEREVVVKENEETFIEIIF